MFKSPPQQSKSPLKQETQIATVQVTMAEQRHAGGFQVGGNNDATRVELGRMIMERLLFKLQCALLGVSTRTINRRLNEFGISVRDTYTKITDEELDNLLSSVKAESPHLGHRMMKGQLQAWVTVCHGQGCGIHASSGLCWNTCKNYAVEMCRQKDLFCPGPTASCSHRRQSQAHKV
ncbi:unnamed protein product [Leuciscus chuanchicus]